MTRDEAIEIIGIPVIDGWRCCSLCHGLNYGCPRDEALCTVERDWFAEHPPESGDNQQSSDG